MGFWFFVLSLLILFNTAIILRLIKQNKDLSNVVFQPQELTIGQEIPNFSAFTLSGLQISSNDFSGQELIIIFFSPFCAMCKSEINQLVDLHSNMVRQVKILLVTTMRVQDVEPIVKSWGIRFEVVVAPKRKSNFVNNYNPRGILPYFCHISHTGKIIKRGPMVGNIEWKDVRNSLLSDIAKPERVLYEQYR